MTAPRPRFSSKGLDTSKVGDLNVGAIVPVRYDAGRTHAVLDIPKLEAAKAAKVQAADKWLERRKAEQIAAADAALAKGAKGQGRPGRPPRPGHRTEVGQPAVTVTGRESA